MKRLLTALVLYLTTHGWAYAQRSKVQPDSNQYREVIADLGRITIPNGLQESYKIQIGGIPQWIYVRGENSENPLILFVHGGPASPIIPTSWQFQRPIEEYFTVVNWDQRGAGKTYLESDPDVVAPTLKVAQYVSDIIELSEFLRNKYHKKKIVLMAHSWGTIISLKAAAARPDLFYAYIGIGQIVNERENERISYAYGLTQARLNSNQEAIDELQSIAPYPGNTPITRDRVIIARKWPQYYGGLTAYRDNSMYYYRGGILSPEYSTADLQAIDKGSLLTVDRVMPDVLNADFESIRSLSLPVIMFLGRNDYTTPTEPVIKWMATLTAPYKKMVWFENSAHMIPWEEPGKTLLTLVEYVRPLAE